MADPKADFNKQDFTKGGQPGVEQSLVERYYTPYLVKEAYTKPVDDHYVYRHSNSLLIVGLADSHPIVAEKKKFKSVNFSIDGKIDRSVSKVHGKGSKGGVWLEPTSPLCIITCEDESVYTVYSCVRGNLVEVNMRLPTEPRLLEKRAKTEGYIAIIKPKQQEKNLAPHEFRMTASGDGGYGKARREKNQEARGEKREAAAAAEDSGTDNKRAKTEEGAEGAAQGDDADA